MSPDDYSDLPEDERPIGQAAAKGRAKKLLADPKYRRGRGHPDDERTRDGDMADPKNNGKGEDQ